MVIIGMYEFDQRYVLGKGSFGTVYKGHHRENKQHTVAIKVIQLENIKDTAKVCMDREINIMQKFSSKPHRNIVTMLHCEQQTEEVLLVMEHCNGGNLDAYLKSIGGSMQVNETTLKLFLKQIGAGLEAAHAKDIIHRDLKPENILLSFDGQQYPSLTNITVKIADFGVGRFLEAGQVARTQCGTLSYMAPEVIWEKGHDKKADLWSVGIIAYRCLVGNVPQAPWAGVQIPSSVSDTLKDLLSGLLQTEPSNRFSAQQLCSHRFLESSTAISITVNGPGATRLIQAQDNWSVDNLIDEVSSTYGLSEDANVYLIHDGQPLEYGSGSSLSDSGIGQGSSIQFCARLPGGQATD